MMFVDGMVQGVIQRVIVDGFIAFQHPSLLCAAIQGNIRVIIPANPNKVLGLVLLQLKTYDIRRLPYFNYVVTVS